MQQNICRRLLLYPDQSTYRNEFVESLGAAERQINASVRTVVLIDVSSEGASPGGVVDSEDMAFERHPVVYEGIIFSDSVIFHSDEVHFLGFAVKMEGSSRCIVALRVQPSAYDGSAHYQLTLAVIMQVLGSDANEDIGLSIDVSVALEIVPVTVHLGPLAVVHSTLLVHVTLALIVLDPSALCHVALGVEIVGVAFYLDPLIFCDSSLTVHPALAGFEAYPLALGSIAAGLDVVTIAIMGDPFIVYYSALAIEIAVALGILGELAHSSVAAGFKVIQVSVLLQPTAGKESALGVHIFISLGALDPLTCEQVSSGTDIVLVSLVGDPLLGD